MRILALALLFATACSRGPETGPWLWAPTRGLGSIPDGARRERHYFLTRWFGADPSEADTPPATEVLGDARDAFVVPIPLRHAVELPAHGGLRFTAGVRRVPANDPTPGPAGPIICEVFLETDQGLESLARVELDEPERAVGDPWQTLDAELPPPAGDGARRLLLVSRWSDPGAADRGGARVAWANPALTRRRPAAARPDVLLLTVDTLRADALGHAPELAGLLERGTLWPRAVSPSSWTLPAYGSLFTAREPEIHGAGRGPFAVQATGEPENRNFQGLRPELPTLAEAFRDAGYSTAMFHQNPFLEPWSGIDRGFETYVRTVDDARVGVARARAWWEANAGRPRFLVLHRMAPHLPYDPPDPAGELPADPLAQIDWRAFLAADHTPEQRRRFFDLPESEREAVRQRYAAEVASVDEAVTPWLDALFAEPSPPILALHSDHGEELWDEGSFEHGHCFHDSVVRVPLAVVHPPAVPARRDEAGVTARDLAPTLLRLAGIPRPPGWDGDLFETPSPVLSTRPLYRAPTGGRRFDPDGGSEPLPFDPTGSAAAGAPAQLPPGLEAALAQLGYLNDAENDGD